MSVARTLRQLSAVSSRVSSRQLAVSSTRTLLARRVAQPSTLRAFSASARASKAGSSDAPLSLKLEQELTFELNEQQESAEPEFLTSFKKQGLWTVIDEAGNNEVTLTRQFGNENIRLVFSVSDLANQEPNEFEDMEERSDEEQESGSDAMRAVVSITKGNAPGALDIDMTVQGGQFLVENVTFYNDSKLGQDISVEGDWKRRGLYIGPEFTTLDVHLQEQFEKFLQERDVGEATAFFIPEYAQFKEQKEYVQWLKNVRDFIDA
ncbi:unnamed protein product [Mycena citricolor]|uniref:Mitochondrial glyco protein n=1 Tax=Mycena citricolor TaxID=2018698 RepID=A0AAD2K1L2_9AGAR|nr:unnamed protein product [Mycena citricolor]